MPAEVAQPRDRVDERRRAAALARHYRDQEGLPIAEVARRLGRAEATIKAYLYDPTGEKARAVKRRYQGVCRGCGAPIVHGRRPVRQLGSRPRRRVPRQLSSSTEAAQRPRDPELLQGSQRGTRARHPMPAAHQKRNESEPADDHNPTPDEWHELQVANPSFLVEKLDAECTDPQGPRELTINAIEAIAALGRAPAAASCGISTGSASKHPAGR